MKTKKEKFFKQNFVGFIIGGIIFGTLGVYAAITFPSNEVSFDPSNSTLTSTDVQGAIDELYQKCTGSGEPVKSAAEQIIEDSGIKKDENECRYFFIGSNPNNYITFNDQIAKWRIISVECDGTIKIIKQNSVRDSRWDSGKNNWDRPAELNTYLNDTYYNKLNSIAQSQIVSHNFSIGAITNGDTNLANTINKENSKIWNGKIALPTVSEYIRSNSNKIECGTVQKISTYTKCEETTWMHNDNTSWWTLTPYSGDDEQTFVIVSNYGELSHYPNYSNSFKVRPVLYLSQDIKITGGTGTKSDPYEISL